MPFSQELADLICDRIADGESLRAICRSDGMPAPSTVCLWLSQNPGFSEQYARAREAQADALAEETLEIADDARNDWMERQSDGDKSEGWVLNGEHVQRSRLRIDARKWFASKVAPKKYGDKVQAEVSGPDGNPLQMLLGGLGASVDSKIGRLIGGSASDPAKPTD